MQKSVFTNMAQVQEKKGGPYTRNAKMKRQNEVYKLHFEHDYSAVKISELMKINRNTINSDISHWYTSLAEEWESYDMESWYMKQVRRLESQRSRIFEELSKAEDASARLSIEKMILDIDCKLMNFISKSSLSANSAHNGAVAWVNNWAKENNIDLKLMDAMKMNVASSETTEKIKKLLKDDMEKIRGKKMFPKKH
jgi:predicted DNA-binding protein YlxM (UPF0122 family)